MCTVLDEAYLSLPDLCIYIKHLYSGMASFLSNTIENDRWLSEAEEVFSDKEYTPVNSAAPSLNTGFRNFNTQYKAHIKSWWEVKG